MYKQIEKQAKAEFPETVLEEILESTFRNNIKGFLEFKEYWEATNIELIDIGKDEKDLYLLFREKENPENISIFHIDSGEVTQYLFHGRDKKLYEMGENKFIPANNYLGLLELCIENNFGGIKLNKKQKIQLSAISENVTLAYNTILAKEGTPIRIRNGRLN